MIFRITSGNQYSIFNWMPSIDTYSGFISPVDENEAIAGTQRM